MRLLYDLVYDLLAVIDVAGGVLLAAIGLQIAYASLFRALHGPDAGRVGRGGIPSGR